VMRLRRALVQDIFSALEQAGNLKIITGRRAGTGPFVRQIA
jgi:hypothetical protein